MPARFRAYLSSLRFRILMMVLLCWLLPTLVLGGYMGLSYSGALREKTEAALTLGAEHAQNLTLQIIKQAISMAKDVTYDGELSTTAGDYAAGKITYQDFYRISRNYLERKYGRESLFTFASYFRTENPAEYMYTSAGYQSALRFLQEDQEAVLSLGETLDTRCRFFCAGGQAYLVRNLYNLRMERYGMLVLGLNINQLLAPLLDSSQMWGTNLDVQLDDYLRYEGEPVSWEQEALGLREEKDVLHYVQKETQRDFTLYTRVGVEKSVVYAQTVRFQQLLILLVLAIVPIGSFIMWFVHRRIAKPIFLLSNASQRMQEGELGVTVPMHGQDELGRLGTAFSSMSTQIRRLVDTVYKEEIALRDARIEAMQSRINPHFLNNALEMITWQARMDSNGTIAAMVEALSVLMNAGLDVSEAHLATLKTELEVADAYFYFVKLRFSEKLTVWKDVNPALLPKTMPRMVIQTLLENAIEHGIAPAGGGHIRLNVFSDELYLHVEVINNGRKLSQEDRDRISALLKEDGTGEGHVGIRNVSQRLRLIYGGRAMLKITSDAHGDTVAAVLIPLEHTTSQPDTTNDILRQ